MWSNLSAAWHAAPWRRILSAKPIMPEIVLLTGSSGLLADLGMAVENRRHDLAPENFQVSRAEAGLF